MNHILTVHSPLLLTIDQYDDMTMTISYLPLVPGGHARVHWLHRSGIREIPRRVAREHQAFLGATSAIDLCCKSCVQEISIDNNSILIILSFLP